MTPPRRSEVVFPELEPPEPDKGSAWPVFLVVVFGCVVLGAIAWGVVV